MTAGSPAWLAAGDRAAQTGCLPCGHPGDTCEGRRAGETARRPGLLPGQGASGRNQGPQGRGDRQQNGAGLTAHNTPLRPGAGQACERRLLSAPLARGLGGCLRGGAAGVPERESSSQTPNSRPAGNAVRPDDALSQQPPVLAFLTARLPSDLFVGTRAAPQTCSFCRLASRLKEEREDQVETEQEN